MTTIAWLTPRPGPELAALLARWEELETIAAGQ